MLHGIPGRTGLVIGLSTRGTFQLGVRERTQNVAIVSHTCNPSTQEARAQRKRKKLGRACSLVAEYLCVSAGCWCYFFSLER